MTLEAERHLQHQIGRPEADGWGVHALADQPGRFLSYGGYTRDIQPGARRATFRLMVDDVAADNNEVLAVEVHEVPTKTVLVRRAIRRREFAAPFTYQDFPADFYASPGRQLEFRTFWHGGTYARQDSVTVTAVPGP